MDIGHTMVTQNVYISVQIGSLSRYISHGKIHEINTWQCHIQTGCVYVTPLCYKQGYLPCIVITFQGAVSVNMTDCSTEWWTIVPCYLSIAEWSVMLIEGPPDNHKAKQGESQQSRMKTKSSILREPGLDCVWLWNSMSFQDFHDCSNPA